jgi:YVTN family beta-propeller protein
MMKTPFLNCLNIVFISAVFVSCTSSRIYKTYVSEEGGYHSLYDEKTIAQTDSNRLLMPYNRFIDPVGTVIHFGNPNTENHSLDCALMPDSNILAVEDRFGVSFVDVHAKKILYHLDYDGKYKGSKSSYSGMQVWTEGKETHVYWSVSNAATKKSFVFDAIWDGKKAVLNDAILLEAVAPAPMALPNAVLLNKEEGETYLYVVLNGNNQLIKIRLKDKQRVWSTSTGVAPYGMAIASSKAYVTNWAGPVPTDASKETAGVPYGEVYIDHRTGATASGTVSVIDLKSGKLQTEVEVGLHPNAVIASADQKFIYVANGNSDDVSVINTETDKLSETIPVKLNKNASYIGDSPNGLGLDPSNSTLYVCNGMDNAIAVVKLGQAASARGSDQSSITGFIPTEAYPAAVVSNDESLFVCNLEGEGARVVTQKGLTCHQQEATISIIPLPDTKKLQSYTKRVEDANLLFRTKLAQLMPRKNVVPKPVPERIGEPSVFKHVVYIIKENKTYDQVLGDMPEGNGMKSLCIFGDQVTPNEHKLAKQYLLLDNFYASGKSSAEGHSWTDAAMVTDYIEKSVFAWFRSYPHVLADALVYNKEGFIWNNALDHGKTVRIYGEACKPDWQGQTTWKQIYQSYLDGNPVSFTNSTTISRVEPILSPSYPCFDGPASTDQIKADAFIKELKKFEEMPGDQLPQLMVLALPADHTVGMREGFPTPRAMVADNDLALGRIIEALTTSRFWDSTVVFVTQDDPQSGWDHVSSYRTTGFVISPYSRLSKTVHTNYNQTCMVRTIEQILGIPPMNVMDATALPMFDCFTSSPNKVAFTHVKNNIRLDEMNPPAISLKGLGKKYSRLSSLPEFDKIDGGDDDLLNHIVWYSAMGKTKYPKQMTLSKKEQEDLDD